MNYNLKYPQYKIFCQLILIVFLCLVIYIPSLQNGFIWDDDVNIYKSPWFQKADGLRVIWLTGRMYQYYPVDFTTFWIEHKLWGVDPFGYHVVNLLLHILNALLVFWVVRKLYARLALPVALLFTIHPIQVETVAWITERKNLLSLFFFLLAVLSYLRFDRTQRIRDYLLTVIMFICALLSKSIAVCFISFPALYKWWHDGKVTLREIKSWAVFAAIGLISALYTLYLEFYNVGAQGKGFGLTFMERFLLSGRVIFFYIHKTLFPFNFIFFYPRWAVDAGMWWQWLFPFAAILVLAGLTRYRKRVGRGALALFLFYIISIFPVMGFLNVYGMVFSFVADHFSYLSTPALLLLLCATIGFLYDKLSKKIPFFRALPNRFIIAGLFMLITIYMVTESMALTGNYKNNFTLWRGLIEKNPGAWIAYNNLGTAYANTGRPEEAVVLYKKAIEVKPDYAEAYNNLATAYANTGRPEEAIALYKAMALKPQFARMPLSYYKLGNIYLNLGRIREAIEEYKKAIGLNPYYPDAHNSLCNAYIIIGNNHEAIDSCRKAIHFNPDMPQAYYNLGDAYDRSGRKDDAIEAYEKAIRIAPGYVEAFNNLASVYADTGEIDKAIGLWEKAVQLDPGFSTAHFNLAVFYYQKGEYDLAVEHCDEVIKLGNRVDPEFLESLREQQKGHYPYR
ncbi:MAG: tetratricopeptide repeat protein [Candidatus Omnitrophota bacterium]